MASTASAEQASDPTSPAAGRLEAGADHTCALLSDGRVRCWGFNADGQLGYANTATIGDNETPGSVGPVNLGGGHTAKAIVAGDYHTCALLDDSTVRCWGFGAQGRLGYGNTNTIGDDETPGATGPVDLGPGRTANAITAGAAHTCALLDDGNVRCWGYGGGGSPHDGRLGYGNTNIIGDDETPGSVAPVKLGTGRTAKAISAGGDHTCALLDDNTVRCWGHNDFGQLGYGNIDFIGDDESPDAAGPVNLGPGRTAKAITTGGSHTCAILDDSSVRCWGYGGKGQLGYGGTATIADRPATTPNMEAPVDLGPGRTALAISAGTATTCARLDNQSVRCWGYGANGRLGYGNTETIGDDETPGSVGPVDLGLGRNALAVSAGKNHTCARLDDQSVRCWGQGANGQLGYCNRNSLGDDEPPGSVGPIDLGDGAGGAGCVGGPPVGSLTVTSALTPARTATATTAAANQAWVSAEAIRARGLQRCLARRVKRAISGRSQARRRSTRRRSMQRRDGSVSAARRRCLHLFGRTPGPITGIAVRAVGQTELQLSFDAPGTDGDHPPAAHSYVIKQSFQPIRGPRSFARAHTLCGGHCRFGVSQVGRRVSLTITDLKPRTIYYYAVAARDNVSGHRGPASRWVKEETPSH